MKNRFFKSYLLLIFLVCLTIISCEWNELGINTNNIENVSFSQDIIPVFNQSCNSIGCHNNTGTSPDLSIENAYKDLYDENMIDLTNPSNSILYKRMIDTKNSMPLGGVLSKKVQKTILVWIKEGAKDN
jgi:hypothetical protein